MLETLSPAARAYLLWSLTEGVGPMTMTRLVERFGSPQAALTASARSLETVPGIGPRSADVIAHSRDQAAVEPELEAAANAGVALITRADPAFPPGLRQIGDAPIVLYVRGELAAADALAVAVVGTRRCSRYGQEQARRFGEALASLGLTVVSGLARGVDSAAHLGALDAGGRTIAVVGCGLSDIYPPENRALAERIAAGHGAVVSELPLHASVRRENFPSRNRLIAGMSLGTLVIEAPARSGALITARLAAEYNREVFALPGRVNEPNAHGVNRLIRSGGAKLVTCLEDVLEELGQVGAALRQGAPPPGPVVAASGTPVEGAPATSHDGGLLFETGVPEASCGPTGGGPTVQEAIRAALSPLERAVFERVDADPSDCDRIVAAAELPAGQVLAALTALELKGLVRQLPGRRVQRTGPR